MYAESVNIQQTVKSGDGTDYRVVAIGDAAFYGTGARDLTAASEGLLPGTASLMSAGASLSVRLGNLLWVPFDTRIGVDWSYNFGPSFDAFRAGGLKLERHYFGLLFSVDY